MFQLVTTRVKRTWAPRLGSRAQCKCLAKCLCQRAILHGPHNVRAPQLSIAVASSCLEPPRHPPSNGGPQCDLPVQPAHSVQRAAHLNKAQIRQGHYLPARCQARLRPGPQSSGASPIAAASLRNHPRAWRHRHQPLQTPPAATFTFTASSPPPHLLSSPNLTLGGSGASSGLARSPAI